MIDLMVCVVWLLGFLASYAFGAVFCSTLLIYAQYDYEDNPYIYWYAFLVLLSGAVSLLCVALATRSFLKFLGGFV